MKSPHAFSGIVFAVLVTFMSAGAADKSVKLQPFPGQPTISAALKRLGQAKDTAGTKLDDAIVHLKHALVQLEASKSNRGSFRATSIRLTKQAIKYFEEKNIAAGMHEVEEAIKNVTKAGEAGDKVGAKR